MMLCWFRFSYYVSLGSVFFSVLTKMLAGKSLHKMTCYVLSGTLSIYTINQSIQQFNIINWVTRKTPGPLGYYYYNHFTVVWILSGTILVSQLPERQNQEGKTNLDLLEQERVNGGGISWAIRKSAPCPRQITTLLLLHPFYSSPLKTTLTDLKADLYDASQHGDFCEVNRTENLNLLWEQLLNVTHQACVHSAGIITLTRLMFSYERYT